MLANTYFTLTDKDCVNQFFNFYLTFYMCEYLSPRPFLLAKEKGVEGNVSDLNNLEPNSGNITDGVTLTAKTSNQDFVIFFNKVQTTILRYESSDLLTVLDQLYTDALSDGRVRLLSLNTDLKQEFELV